MFVLCDEKLLELSAEEQVDAEDRFPVFVDGILVAVEGLVEEISLELGVVLKPSMEPRLGTVAGADRVVVRNEIELENTVTVFVRVVWTVSVVSGSVLS